MSFKRKIVNFQEEIPIHFVQYSEIISSLKPYLNISKLVGLLNVNLIENVVAKGNFCTFLSFWNIILLLNQIFLLVVRVSKGQDFVKVSGPDIVLRLHVIFIHLWSLFYSKKLAKALKSCPLLENRVKIYRESDFINTQLKRKCILLVVFYILLAMCLILKTFIVDLISEEKSIGQIWEDYSENCGLEKNTFSHYGITSSYCLVMDIVTNLVWILGDLLLVIVSIIMAELYWRINENISHMEPSRFTASEIDLLREHHGLISKLVTEFDDALSSLNLINVTFNIAFLVIGSYSVISLRNRERQRMSSSVNKLFCKIAVAAFKLSAGLVAASVLHHRAHRAIVEIRSWPMAREHHDFAIYNGRVSVIHAFLAQLSNPSIGFTIGKFLTITAKLLVFIGLGVGFFFAFSRITISTCSRNTTGRVNL